MSQCPQLALWLPRSALAESLLTAQRRREGPGRVTRASPAQSRSRRLPAVPRPAPGSARCTCQELRPMPSSPPLSWASQPLPPLCQRLASTPSVFPDFLHQESRAALSSSGPGRGGSSGKTQRGRGAWLAPRRCLGRRGRPSLLVFPRAGGGRGHEVRVEGCREAQQKNARA